MIVWLVLLGLATWTWRRASKWEERVAALHERLDPLEARPAPRRASAAAPLPSSRPLQAEPEDAPAPGKEANRVFRTAESRLEPNNPGPPGNQDGQAPGSSIRLSSQMLVGPRQVGKTTLLLQLLAEMLER